MLPASLVFARPEAAPQSSPQWDAARILSIEDRREAPSALRAYFASARPETRARACLAAGRIAAPPEPAEYTQQAEKAIIRLLTSDPVAEVRRAAAFALGLLQTPRAGAGLAGLLARGNERDATVRAAAAAGLGRCGPDPHPAAMRAALHDPDPRVVQDALLAVWKGSRTQHLERILELTHATDVETRWRAAHALMRSLGAPPSGRTPVAPGGRLSAGERETALERLLVLAGDLDLRVRLQALRALGGFGDDAADRRRARPVLEAGLDAADARERTEAIRALGQLLAGSKAGSVLALQEALRDPHAHVRIAAIQAAGAMLEAPALLEALEEAATTPAIWERASALGAVAAAATEAGWLEQAVHLVERGQADDAWPVRYAAAEAAGALWRAAGSDAALRPLLLAMMRAALDDHPRVAKGVVAPWVAAQSEASDTLEALCARLDPLLTHRDKILRALVVSALAEHIEGLDQNAPQPTAGSRWAPLLTAAEPLAYDPSIDVRLAAVDLHAALLATGAAHEGEAALLEIARHDPDRLVRHAAITALRDAGREAALRAGPSGCASCPRRPVTLGPQETGRTLADYRQALAEASRVDQAILVTGDGELRIQLRADLAPLTVLNFVRLAERGYFDGGNWHRVVPDFVIQDGCPRGDGWGGPGHAIRCEINAASYHPGTLGMALSGKDTGGSQFFLTLSDQPHLDGRYTIFGQLIAGAEVMQAIEQGAVIERVEIRYRD